MKTFNEVYSEIFKKSDAKEEACRKIWDHQVACYTSFITSILFELNGTVAGVENFLFIKECGKCKKMHDGRIDCGQMDNASVQGEAWLTESGEKIVFRGESKQTIYIDRKK